MRDGASITTVEGLADGVTLHPLQQSFIDHDALQCGYCTPGQLCSAAGLIKEGEARTLDDVRELMSGNLCRCGAYVQIAQAVAEVALGPGPHLSERARKPIVTGTVPG
jgi:xanthine dehydrogenase YagT iron-sulfur-binding subunit